MLPTAGQEVGRAGHLRDFVARHFVVIAAAVGVTLAWGSNSATAGMIILKVWTWWICYKFDVPSELAGIGISLVQVRADCARHPGLYKECEEWKGGRMYHRRIPTQNGFVFVFV